MTSSPRLSLGRPAICLSSHASCWMLCRESIPLADFAPWVVSLAASGTHPLSMPRAASHAKDPCLYASLRGAEGGAYTAEGECEGREKLHGSGRRESPKALVRRASCCGSGGHDFIFSLQYCGRITRPRGCSPGAGSRPLNLISRTRAQAQARGPWCVLLGDPTCSEGT